MLFFPQYFKQLEEILKATRHFISLRRHLEKGREQPYLYLDYES
jgi:hypothetical protein